MNLYEIPCDGNGKKIRVLDSEVTGVRVYVDTPCYCPFCVDDDNDVQFVEEYRECEDQEDEYFEERLSDCFE
ncbi:hypothetical protein ABFY57_12075 [Paenibacillus polymyxa]|uniref:hypothetical protein n=1 Tax=Paenibacillus polymyxa TaxID=1406 RepID=UPI0020199287|nr:hypothetical protein [Paenibacillus polymyxa]UQQ36185.1 hypothetical protein LMH85_04500 [Paenibacillus polymyxa]